MLLTIQKETGLIKACFLARYMSVITRTFVYVCTKRSVVLRTHACFDTTKAYCQFPVSKPRFATQCGGSWTEFQWVAKVIKNVNLLRFYSHVLAIWNEINMLNISFGFTALFWKYFKVG